MSSGGGGTNTVQTTIPDWMQQYVQNNYNTAQNVANTPFTPYSGQAVAPLNSTQQLGNSMSVNAGTSGIGMGAVNQGVANETAAGNYQPAQVGYSGPTSAQISQYSNPYTQDVINTTNADINQQQSIAQQQNASSAVGAGAYGGSRQGVQDALTNKYYGQVAANADSQLNSANYNQAMNTANTVNASNLTAAQSNQQAGLTGNQQAIQSGMILGQLAPTQQGIALGGANAVTAAGNQQQAIQQAQDQYGYQTYMQQLMWPYQQLNALEGATYGGNPGGSTSSPLYSNNWAQGIGLGMAGLGMANSMGWLGGGAAAAGGGAAAAGGGAAAGEAAAIMMA